ncbi:MAG: MurR/RpiR family transcriptional regulator [Geminicoccaceae bacterium]
MLAELRAASHSLSPALARVAEYVLGQPEAVLSQTVTELAEQAGSSEATIIRLCRAQGFGGFQAFKLALASELATSGAAPARPRDEVGGLVALADTALRDTEALLDRALLDRVAQRLLAARRILLFGAGASAISARYGLYKLVRLGLPAVAHDDAHHAAMAATGSGPEDVVVVVSSSGSTVDSVRVAELAGRSGAFVVAVTNRQRSPLVTASAAALVGAAPETPLTGGAFPAKLGQLLLLEAVYTRLQALRPELATAIEATARSVTDRSF